MALQTFLRDAVRDRIAPMLREVSTEFDRRVERVIPYWTDNAPAPCWLIYNAPPSRQSVASAASTQALHQTYTLTLRLNYLPLDAGVIGAKEEFVGWILIPTVLDYFAARRGLCYTEAQVAPTWLEPNKTAIALASAFGTFGGTPPVVGVEFTLSLTFQQIVSSVYNNP